jgi:hypothetical protein
MGRGNWRATNRSCDDQYSDEVYVEILDLMEERDEDAHEMAYEEFKDHIQEILPASYTLNSDRRGSLPEGTLFYNRHVLVVWDTQGDVYHQGIGVRLQPGLPDKELGIAERSARATFRKLKVALCKSYKCSVWTSPWTSKRIN